jgi:putative NIF3 family GTP cyclohydrolase 1 type 2
MRPALLAIAAECGATLYLTGTLKDKVYPFLEQSHITVVGVGQRAAEQWGMLWLGSHLQMEFGIEIVWLDSDQN